jgi:hypothetical protein
VRKPAKSLKPSRAPKRLYIYSSAAVPEKASTDGHSETYHHIMWQAEMSRHSQTEYRDREATVLIFAEKVVRNDTAYNTYKEIFLKQALLENLLS